MRFLNICGFRYFHSWGGWWLHLSREKLRENRLCIPFDKSILDAHPLVWSWQIHSVYLSCFLPVGIKLLHKHLCSLLNSYMVDGQKQLLCIVLWLTHMCRGMYVHTYTCINKRNKNFNIWTKETRDKWFVLAHSNWPSRQGRYNYRRRKPPGVDAGSHQSHCSYTWEQRVSREWARLCCKVSRPSLTTHLLERGIGQRSHTKVYGKHSTPEPQQHGSVLTSSPKFLTQLRQWVANLFLDFLQLLSMYTF